MSVKTPDVTTKYFSQDEVMDLLRYAVTMIDPTCLIEGREIEDIEMEVDKYKRVSAKVYFKLREKYLAQAEEDEFEEFDTIDDVVNAEGGYLLEVEDLDQDL